MNEAHHKMNNAYFPADVPLPTPQSIGKQRARERSSQESGFQSVTRIKLDTHGEGNQQFTTKEFIMSSEADEQECPYILFHTDSCDLLSPLYSTFSLMF